MYRFRYKIDIITTPWFAAFITYLFSSHFLLLLDVCTIFIIPDAGSFDIILLGMYLGR